MNYKLQQTLLKIHELLQPKENNIKIQFLKDQIQITYPNKDSLNTLIKETILLVFHQKKDTKIQNYIKEIFEASLNFDLEYLNEENTNNLLQVLVKPNLSNGINLFLYSKLETKFSQIDKKTFLQNIKQKIQRNRTYILKIAF
ncbi:12789_t:CDS:1 [Cetraspora pellucida]|uniref:12789_t:CDS:1 n=1 Tax=Cetraspora pellucida TaxID=1433469 RepID=A0A9N9CZZ6_9GLOM|nr:12789_t:CDS:1 [Cetraspora pellucida]